MERKVNTKFQVHGVWFQCVKGTGCDECHLHTMMCYHDAHYFGYCSPQMRSDGNQVVFKKLEEPITSVTSSY